MFPEKEEKWRNLCPQGQCCSATSGMIVGVWPLWMYRARLDEDVPIESYSPGTWVCNQCYRVTFGPDTRCHGQKTWRCRGTVHTTLAGYVR